MKKLRRNDKRFLRITLILAVVLMAHATITTIRGNVRQKAEFEAKQKEWEQEKARLDAELERLNTKEEQEAAEPDKYAVFDSMSRDWGDEIEGFKFYEIPEQYKKTGGYFPEIMQIYTYCLCQQEGVSYPLIVAMIERESGYRFDCVGDNGESLGYMQINMTANIDRLEEMGCTDLLNPYQNVRVGIARMKELIDKYGTMQDALAAYNYGEAGAKQHLWSKGKYLYSYNEGILKRMREIEKEVQE